ncbi:MAG: hypothetical protein WD225_01475 [Ilumatobacteraceae bacterium]
MKAVDRTFSTVVADHGNCSVGSMTHGFATLEEVAGHDDVATLLGTGWGTEEQVPGIPVVSQRPGALTYGPLTDTPVDPDVVLVRLTARSLMFLSDAVPGLEVESKPQCHIWRSPRSTTWWRRASAACSAGCGPGCRAPRPPAPSPPVAWPSSSEPCGEPPR